MGKFTIGITGGIGAGKSVVSRALRCNGVFVYDCDFEAKKLMTHDSDLKDSLIKELGKEIYLSDGFLDRKRMATIIFSDKQKRDYVNLKVHRAVYDDIERKRRSLEGLFFIETAIPSTGGIDLICDSIWIIEADEETRLKRVELRDGMTREQILKRMETQELELTHLNCPDIVYIKNDNEHPMLPFVLEKINKFKIKSIYKLPC